jgi:hypothetical protein
VQNWDTNGADLCDIEKCRNNLTLCGISSPRQMGGEPSLLRHSLTTKDLQLLATNRQSSKGNRRPADSYTTLQIDT